MSSGPVTPKLWQTTMRIRPRNKRTQPLAFIGVQTGVNSNAYSSRRTDLRRAWFPADEAAMKRVEEDYGLIVRFVVGHTPSREHEVALQKETEEFGPFLRLPINDTYEGLPWKTHAFVVTAFRLYNPKFVVKLDDDVYVRLDRLRLALAQYEERKFEFIGCMRREPIVSVPGKRYYEPDHVRAHTVQCPLCPVTAVSCLWLLYFHAHMGIFYYIYFACETMHTVRPVRAVHSDNPRPFFLVRSTTLIHWAPSTSWPIALQR